MLVLSFGLSKTSNAVMQCSTERLGCCGQQWNVLICGESEAERKAEMIEAYIALCYFE